MATPTNFPISPKRLEQIANDAINVALAGADCYEHPKTEQWNKTIIEKALKAVIAEATPQGATTMPYKFAVNSTIVQHVVPSSQMGRSVGTSTNTADATEGGAAKAAGSEKKLVGRRGMHSSTGGYWNEKTDGMWSYKFEGENMGLDVVLMLIWVST